MNILDYEEMNPRYVEYCRAHGKTPDVMLALDRKRWPGGCMCGFILWNMEKVQEFTSQWKGCRCLADVTLALLGDGKGEKKDVHAIYNEWLHEAVNRDLAQKGTAA